MTTSLPEQTTTAWQLFWSDEFDGTPASGPYTASSACSLTIGGQAATVQYCRAAPGEVIDQLNFVYPPGVPAGSTPVTATLTIGGQTGTFLIAAPAQ